MDSGAQGSLTKAIVSEEPQNSSLLSFKIQSKGPSDKAEMGLSGSH